MVSIIALATTLVLQFPVASDASPSASLMLFSLLLGLILAIAFQAVLANFGIAIGLSFARPFLTSHEIEETSTASSTAASDDNRSEDSEPLFSQGKIVSAVGVIAGLSLLLTVDTELFGATFLAVRFSQLVYPLRGITLGLSIWAIYLLLLLFLGSSALGSTAELILGGAVTTVRRLLELMKQVLRSPPAQKPMPKQQEAMVTVKQQLDQLQDKVRLLTVQAEQIQKAPAPKTAVPAATSTPLTNRSLHQPRTQAMVDGAMASLPDEKLDLKAAALSQAVALASTAQTKISGSWQQAKDQVLQQADDSASALFSELHGEIQSQAHQAMEQVDLSDWSLECLWDWARSRSQGDETRDGNLQVDAALSTNLDQPSHCSVVQLRHFFDAASPEVNQFNRDLKNYLKYTSLAKLDSDALEQKLEELLEPFIDECSNEKTGTGRPLSRPSAVLKGLSRAAWQQALQSRRGIEPAQLEQYLSVIERKLLPFLPSEAHERDEAEGVLLRLKAKLSPMVEHLNLQELSLEDFKQFVMTVIQSDDLAGGATERPNPARLEQPEASLNGKQATVADEIATAQPPSSQSDRSSAPSQVSEEEPSEKNFLQGEHDVLHSVAGRAKALFEQLDESLKQSIEASADLLPNGHPLQFLRDRLPSLSDELVSQLTDLPEQTGEQINQLLEETQAQLGEQISQAQAALESSLNLLQTQALEQAEQVRHWAAVAAWWLFGLTFSSAIAAGAAGYLAVTYSGFRFLALG